MKRFYITFVFASILSPYILAQSNNSSICEEGDCSPSVFSIQLEEVLQPATAKIYVPERTERFKLAFKSFQEIRKTYALKKGWEEKRNESQLAGKSCLRHYQLEAQFSYEYLHNADFKKFVDSNHSNAEGFIKNGFDSSRKGLNLSKRMSSNCKEELDDLNIKKGPSLNELPLTYQTLGQELGYFDEKGQLMKPLDTPSYAGQDISQLSKNKQVKALKEQLGQMPFENVVTDKINGVKNGLDAAKSNMDNLTGAVSNLNSNLGSLLPDVSSLLGKANSSTNKLNDLKGMIPNGSAPDLLSSIGSLFNLGKGLGDKASDLLDKSQNLKNKFDDLKRKSNDLQKNYNNKKSAIDGLLNDLKEVSKKKAELEAKLEDKPKNILDALRQEVPVALTKANDIVDKAVEASKEKDRLLEQLETLLKEKDGIQDEIKGIEDKKDALSDDMDNLDKEKSKVENEVDRMIKQAEKVEELKKKMEDLKPEKILQDAISDCETGLKSMFISITSLEEKQENIKSKLGGLLSFPDKLTNQLSELKILQTDLKLPKNGIPLIGSLQEKVDGLIGKTDGITSKVELLTGKTTALEDKVEGLNQNLNEVKALYEEKTGNISGLKDDLIALITEKADVKGKINLPIDDLDGLSSSVTSFIDKYNIFGKKTECKEGKDLKDELEKVEKELTEAEPELEDLENEFEKAEAEQNDLSEKTKEVENEVREQIEKAEELTREEEFIKKEYGSDIKLDPVTVEEWSESFEIERPYWEAVFHPDDEVVEGQKGRYFEVKLKDADKNVKLLFGPGKYSMSKADFRKKYGSTIGSFVMEALHAMKKSNQDKVKLFIQGSADIVGHETFSGTMDQQFLYENISVLPQQTDPEKFFKNPETKSIPQKNFRNIHLPDLRAQYLKEMIKVYSKKFDPVVLEGVVKDFKDEGERNAIIYLYIPEELLVK